MITTVTARDAYLPVTLAEAKQHLRIVSDDLDLDIQAKLEAAVDWCESVSGRALRISHTLGQKYCQWPAGDVWFDRQPVTAISSVKYFDTAGVETTVNSSNYRLHVSSEAAAYLQWDDAFTRPATDVRDDAVVIVYTAGYATIAAVPSRAKQLILLELSLLFGDLDERQYAATERARDSLLGSMDWGCYR